MAFNLQNFLDPLLRPQLGDPWGSKTEDSVGQWALKNLTKGGVAAPFNESTFIRFDMALVVKRYHNYLETPDLAIFAVSDHRIEALFYLAIEQNFSGGHIFIISCREGGSTNIEERIQEKF